MQTEDYPKLTVANRLRTILFIASWENVELIVATVRLVIGLIFCLPGSQAFDNGPLYYDLIGKAGLAHYGVAFTAAGLCQYYANIVDQRKRVRMYVLCATEWPSLFFVGKLTETLWQHPRLVWSPLWVFSVAIMLSGMACILRLSGPVLGKGPAERW